MFGAGIGRCFYLVNEASARRVAPPAPVQPNRSRRALLALTTAMAVSLGALSANDAHAQEVDACGPTGADGSVDCAPRADRYRNGITYTTPAVDPADPTSGVLDLNVALLDGTAVVLPQNKGAIPAISLTGLGNGSVSLRGADDSEIRTRGDGQAGVRAQTASGNAVVVVPFVSTSGDKSAGIVARTSAGGSIGIGAGLVRTSGANSTGIDARAAAGGDVLIRADEVRTSGYGSAGIVGNTTAGTSRIEVRTVRTEGAYADAIIARASNVDVAISGTVATSGSIAYGVYGRATGGDASVELDGKVTTSGNFSRAIDLYATGGASVTGTGSVKTTGAVSTAVAVRARDGDAVVDLSRVTALGASSNGVSATAVNGNARVSVEKARTEGDFSRTLVAFSTYGDASVVSTGSVKAKGARSTAIDVGADRGLAQVQVNNVSASGDGGIAINADGRTVRIQVDGKASTSGNSVGYGATILSLGSADYYTGEGGNVFITNNGLVSSRGTDMAAVRARAEGMLSIDGAGTFKTRGDNSTALVLTGEDGLVVDTGKISTRGDNALGMDATSGGDAAVRVGRVATSGANATGVRVTAAGDLAFGADRITTAGDNAIGADLTATVDNATVSASIGSISTEGAGAIGLRINSRGVALADVGDVATLGDGAHGVVANGLLGAAVNAGSVSTEGAAANGITASAVGPVTVAVSGLASVSGPGSTAVSASSYYDTDVSVHDLSVSGYGSRGVNATSYGNTKVTVTGTVTGSADQPLGPVVVIGPGGRIQDRATGIISATAYGVATVVNDGSIATSGTLEGGISARGFLGVQVSGTGTVATTGNGATGVYAGSNTNGAVIEQASVTTSGNNATAVFARSYGGAGVNVGTVRTSGNGSIGILAEGGTLAAVVADSVTTSGAGSNGIIAHTYGQAAVQANSVTVTGAGARGIDAASYGQGDSIAAVETLRVSDGQGAGAFAAGGAAGVYAADVIQAGAGHGIAASGATGATAIFGTVASSGNDGRWAGVSAFSSTGDVVVTGENVTATGSRRDAIDAVSYAGNVTVTTAGTVSANGSNAAGIFVNAVGGLADVKANDVRSTASEFATMDVSGDRVSIIAGNVLSTGNNATASALAALNATARVGAADLRVGTVRATGTGTDAVAINAMTTGALDVAAGGNVVAMHDAVVFRTGAGASMTNAGTITGGTGAAIRVVGGPATITNSGAITGALVLTDGNDTVTNSGSLTLGAGTSFGGGNDRLTNSGTVALANDVDFGAGTDSFVNNGTLTFGAIAQASAQRAVALSAVTGPTTRTIAGLESFANTGLIDLRNGIVGDVLNISGAFSGSGNSGLGLDVRTTGTPAADQLVIAGAATGSTVVTINPVGGFTGLQPGIVVVKTGAGTSSNAFVLAASQRDAGLFTRGLVFDAGTGSFALVSAPSTVASKLIKVTEGLQSLWLESADSITARLASDRDTAGAQRGFWMSAVGGVSDRDTRRTITSFGLSQDTNLAYRQDVFGLQLGVDFGSKALGFGVTGGYASSVQNFDASADRTTTDAWNIGAYAAFNSGRFFANALAKYDRYKLRVTIGSTGEKARSTGDGYGGQAEAGIRFGSDRFFAEPLVSLSWQHISLDPLALSATIGFEDREGGRAAAGLRIGGLRDLGPARAAFYAQGDYVRPFDGRDGISVTTGSTTALIGDTRFESYGKGRIGMSITRGQVSGFIEGNGRVGKDYHSGGGRVGLRIGF